MWHHLRRAFAVALPIGAAISWFATNSIPQSIKQADGYIYSNLQWAGWSTPPAALASNAADNLLLSVGLFLMIFGGLAALSWVLEQRRPLAQKTVTLAHVGTPGAALFGIDTTQSSVVIDFKNFGLGPARGVKWKATAGWFARQPHDPIPYECFGGTGVIEPNHTQHVKLLLNQPVMSSDFSKIVRGLYGFYALMEINYRDDSGLKTRTIAYYLDPEGTKFHDRWMLSVCGEGNT